MSINAKTGVRVVSAAIAACMLGGAANADWVIPPWLPTPGGLTSSQFQQSVQGLAVINGQLYAAGAYESAAGAYVGGIASWDGAQWNHYDRGFFTDGSNTPTDVIEYNGKLVVGGGFSTNEEQDYTIRKIAYFDTEFGEWEPLGFGVSRGISNSGSVNAMVIYDGKLIIAGDFTQVYSSGTFPEDGYHNIAAWNGTSWSDVGGGTSGGDLNGDIYGLAVYDGDLYAFGNFTNAGSVSVSNIARWDGANWHDVGGGVYDFDTWFFSYANCGAVYNGELYVGGFFTSADGESTQGIAKWNGEEWSGLEGGVFGAPFSGLFTEVRDLEVFNGHLVATGDFDAAGTTAGIGIASWDGTTWANSIFSSGLDNVGMALAADGDTLYVGGSFTTAGGIDSPLLAVYEAEAPVCAADFNGVNGVTVQDIFDFLTAWLAGNPSANFNGVNGVTVQDIFDFLTAWLAGC